MSARQARNSTSKGTEITSRPASTCPDNSWLTVSHRYETSGMQAIKDATDSEMSRPNPEFDVVRKTRIRPSDGSRPPWDRRFHSLGPNGPRSTITEIL